MKTINILGPILSDRDKEAYDAFGLSMAGTSPGTVRDILSRAKPGEDIEVRINSPGGDVFAGAEIYTMLAERKNVHIKITGLAASAASVIACAGDSEISPSGAFMIHNVQTMASGDFNAMEKTKQTLLTVTESIINVYERKTSLGRDELGRMMNDTTWMSPQDAVRLGFIDRMMFRESDSPTGSAEPAGGSSAASMTLVGDYPISDNAPATAEAQLKLLQLKNCKVKEI